MISRNNSAIALSMVALTIGLACTQQDVQAKSRQYHRTAAVKQNSKTQVKARVLLAKKEKTVRTTAEATNSSPKKVSESKASTRESAPTDVANTDEKVESKVDSKVDANADVKSEAKPDQPVATATAKEPVPTVKGSQISSIGTARLVGDVQPIDTAMLSVLRDFSKSIKETSSLSQSLNTTQRTAVGISLAAIDAAVANAQNHPNRIVINDDKSKYEKSLSAHAWESGLIELANGGRASLNVLWGKKVDGLVNISIAGNCGCKPVANSPALGEFVVVINGRSTLDSGFDIQSQTNVHYWLGKVSGLNVDATACPDGQASGKASIPILKSLYTDDHTQRVTLGKLRAEQPVPTLTSTGDLLKKSSSTGSAPAATGSDTTSQAEIDRIAESLRLDELAKPADVSLSGEERSEKSLTKVTTETHAEVLQTQPRLDPEAVAKAIPKTPGEPQSAEASPSKRATAQVAKPTLGSHIFVPDRALAGEYVTVSVLNLQSKPQASVQLNFNGRVAATNMRGTVSFQVPEDAAPGPTLHVNLVSHPDSAQAVQVLQPLLKPQSPGLPKIDKVAISGNTLTIDGHSFDGLADRNNVVIDGAIDARVIVSSPVQVKALIEGKLPAGPHSVVVTSNGMRSNPEQCDVVVAAAQSIARKPDVKKTSTKRRTR